MSGESQVRRQRNVGWVIVAVLVVLAIGALVIPYMFRGGQEQPASTGTSAPTMSVPPTPSVFPTPTPGVTEKQSAAAPIEVGVDDTAEPASGLVVSVDQLESVDGVAQGSGEVSGPAVRVSITVRNDSKVSVALSSAVVNFDYGEDQTPAAPVTGPGAEPFPNDLGPGEEAVGRFVFTVPLAERDQVRIILDLAAGVPTVIFAGVGPA